MIVEIGKKYLGADGKVHGPLYKTKRYPDRFTDELGNWYDDYGYYWQQNVDCPFRLVAECPVPGAHLKSGT